GRVPRNLRRRRGLHHTPLGYRAAWLNAHQNLRWQKWRPIAHKHIAVRAGSNAMSYIRFGLMILTSTAVMFILMYLNTYAWEHVFFSETRTYMAIMMGATMAVIMLAYMLGMYSNKALNIAIFAGSVIVFALTLWLV